MKPAFKSGLVSLVVAAALGAGCLTGGVAGPNGENDMGVSSDGGPIVMPDMAIDIKAEFDAKVRPLLVGDCGTCHSTPTGGVGPGFLSPQPDVLTTMLAFPGLIGTTPENSRILTKEAHVGPSYHASGSYTPSADLQAHAVVIADWIKLFNQLGGRGAASGADMSVKARIEPFLPMNGETKTLDLGILDPQFTGAKVSFTVTTIGTTLLQLSNIQITATAMKGVHVKTPVFATYAAADPNVAIDINYDYLGKDFTAYPGTSVTFDPSLTIFSYTAGQLINISFDTLEPSGAMMDGGTVTMCKDLTAYNNFKPNLTAALPGMNNACSAGGCHGANGGVGGLNLNGIANTANDAATCLSVLNNTIAGMPDKSPLYLHVTDMTNHAGGKITAGNEGAYLTALTTFINAQK